MKTNFLYLTIILLFLISDMAISQNVGIGTLTPAEKLDVNGDVRVQGGDLYSSTGNLRLRGGNGYVELRTTSPNYGVIIRENGTNDFANLEVTGTGLGLGYNTSGAHMTIESGGNVGVGLTNPAFKLDVNGEISARNKNAIRLRQANYSVIHRNDNANYWMLLTANGTPDASYNTLRPFRIENANGNVHMGNGKFFVNHANGRVGINTTAPTSTLDVQGTAVVNYLAVDQQNGAGEGGEISLRGSGTNNSYQIDNLNGGIRMHANGGEWFVMSNTGKASFSAGSGFPGNYRLYVNGGILTTRAKVAVFNSAQWADYVFAEDYELKSLSEVEAFVKKNKHLPNIPSAEEMAETGNDLGKTDVRLLEKIEELFLHSIDQEKRIEKLETQNQELLKELKEIKTNTKSSTSVEK